MPKPELPYYDWNVCPREGCVYREWRAREAVIVFDTCMTTRRPIAQLKAGDKALALTGVVITFRPGVIRMDRDLAAKGLRSGDTILTYTYRGEGNAAVWFKGKYFPEWDISFTKWPDGAGCTRTSCEATYVDLGEQTWWTKVRLASGSLGWIDMNHSNLDGACALAAPH